MQSKYRLKQLILFLGDLTAYLSGFWLSLFLRHFSLPQWADMRENLNLFLLVFLLWMTINFINGLYDLILVKNELSSYRRLLESAAVSLAVSVAFFYLLPDASIAPKTILLLNIAIGYGLSAFWRFVYNLAIGPQKFQAKVIFVGYTPEVKELIGQLKNQSGKNYEPVAIIDAVNGKEKITGVESYQNLKTIRPAVTNHKAQLVVIAPHLKQDPSVLRELYELLFWPVQVVDLTSFYETVTGRIPPFTFSEGWFLDHLQNRAQPVYEKFRDLADFLSAILLGAFFIVTLPVVALFIKTTSPGPIFYRQRRVGRYGKPFTLYKYRSMYVLSADGSAELGGAEFAQKKDRRVTFIGRFLRKTRLDELPQIINLLKRDITLVGPRPERPEIAGQLTLRMPYYPLRNVVRPGLTGWALLHQNYTDDLETGLQKLQYDLYYIKNRSLLLDLSILLRTINVMARLKGQ